MATGLKISQLENGNLHDQSITNSQGGVGGRPSTITSTGVKTIRCAYRTAANVYINSGYIIAQKGAHKFLVANTVASVNGATHANASSTVATLVNVSSAALLANIYTGTGANVNTITTSSSMAIQGYNTSNALFAVSRITSKHVYDFSGNKYRYRTNAVATSTFANVSVL